MITLTWADTEQTLLEWKFGQRWSCSDFLTACQKAQHMMVTVEHTVDMVIDLSIVRFYPTNLMYLVHTGLRMRSQNTGQIIVVTESSLWSRLYHHFIQIYPMTVLPIKFVSSDQKTAQMLRLSGNSGKLMSV